MHEANNKQIRVLIALESKEKIHPLMRGFETKVSKECVESVYVASLNQFEQCLKEQDFDIILLGMEAYFENYQAAHKLIQKNHAQIPYICCIEDYDEEELALVAIDNGAQDCIFLNHLPLLRSVEPTFLVPKGLSC